MHFCLHKKMDPKVVENILNSGEPGCTAGCIEKFENCVGNDRKLRESAGVGKLQEIVGNGGNLQKMAGIWGNLQEMA